LLQYPPHWQEFVETLKYLETKNILDIGCGVGTMSELCQRHLPHVNYTGMDYSKEAINIAKLEWPEHSWCVKDYTTLDETFVSTFDTLHAGAFLDVLPNGDDVLDFLLSLKAPNLFIGRAKITENRSYSTTYEAYNTITTYSYHHNQDDILRLAKKYGYKCMFSGEKNQCNLLFQRSL